MYGTELHRILREALVRAMWTRSTDDEDNFRHVLCSAIYRSVAPDNVEIPSTRSSGGDIRIFGRNVELKYGSKGKKEKLEAVLDDFATLLVGKSDFTVVSVRLGKSDEFNYLHSVLTLPMMAKNGKAKPTLFDSEYEIAAPSGTKTHSYKGISIFLGATYPHAPGAITPKSGKGKNSTAYLSFEQSESISRSYFLELPTCVVHVDVVGSREDGMISFLFKKADGIDFIDLQSTAFSVDVPYAPNPFMLATGSFIDVHSPRNKFAAHVGPGVAATVVERGIPRFKIF